MLEKFSFSERTKGLLRDIIELAMIGCGLIVLFYSTMTIN